MKILFWLILVMIAGHFIANRGLPRGRISLVESFLLGNWLFLVLNAWLLYLGYGKDWGKGLIYTSSYSNSICLCGLGLIAFYGGTLCMFPKSRLINHSSAWPIRKTEYIIIFCIIIILMPIGFLAAKTSYIEMLSTGKLSDRSPIYVNLSYLLSPAAALSILLFLKYKKNFIYRFICLFTFMISSYGLVYVWSRRPSLSVLFIAMILICNKKYCDPLNKKRMLYIILIVFVASIILLFYRNFMFYEDDIIPFIDMLNIYKTKLWLETSAFSSMVYYNEYLNIDYLYGTSFLSGLFFWIPRAIFPLKPIGIDISTYIGGLPYNLPILLYGEIEMNFSAIGIPIIMFIIGVFIKAIDLIFYSKPRIIVEQIFYLMLCFNMLFFVRGSFNAVFPPIIIQIVIPFLLYKIFKRFFYTIIFRLNTKKTHNGNAYGS